MTPWSVSPRAGCPNAAARSARASIRQAPSSTEYSEWTWRWANDAVDTGSPTIRSRSDDQAARYRAAPAICGDVFGAVPLALPRVRGVDVRVPGQLAATLGQVRRGGPLRGLRPQAPAGSRCCARSRG